MELAISVRKVALGSTRWCGGYSAGQPTLSRCHCQMRSIAFCKHTVVSMPGCRWGGCRAVTFLHAS